MVKAIHPSSPFATALEIRPMLSHKTHVGYFTEQWDSGYEPLYIDPFAQIRAIGKQAGMTWEQVQDAARRLS